MFSKKQNRPQHDESSQIQRKLEVGAKDDPQEKEADAVAAQVARMSESDTATGDENTREKKRETPMTRLLRRHPEAPKAPPVRRAPASIAGPASPVRKKEEEEIMRDQGNR